MALKTLFSAMKREGYIIKDLDTYLLSLNDEPNDRAIDVNAPSQVSNCLRANYYARTQEEKDVNAVGARERRIFDNGTGVHERLQAYLEKQGMLLMEEVPLRNDEYNIQGHTDGFLKLSNTEIGILEIKSINDRNFSALKTAKEEHQMQGLVYIYCTESRRQLLQEMYANIEEFEADYECRKKEYESWYTHLIDGRKYTREEKIANKVKQHDITDRILFNTHTPINKVVFLYENKNDQNLKEFVIAYDEDKMNTILQRYEDLNQYVANKKVPPREGSCKSCQCCRWCNYKIACWN